MSLPLNHEDSENKIRKSPPSERDVFFYISKDYRKVRMVYYERNSFNLYTKTYEKEYSFLNIELENNWLVYKVNWSDLVSILENPVSKSIRINMINSKSKMQET